MKLVEKHGWTYARIGKAFKGKSKEWVGFRMKLANLNPVVQEDIEEKNITATHGRYISEAPANLQVGISQIVKSHDMTTTETKDWLERLKAKEFKLPKGGLEQEFEGQIEVSDDEAKIVESAHSFRAHQTMMSPTMMKTGLFDLSKFKLFNLVPAYVKIIPKDILCKHCGSYVGKCPVCRGDKPKKFGSDKVEIIFGLANKKDVVEAFEKDTRFVEKITKK